MTKVFGKKGQERVDVPLEASGLWAFRITQPGGVPVFSGAAGDRSEFRIYSAAEEMKRWPWWKGYWQIRAKIRQAFPNLTDWGVFPKDGMSGAVLGRPFEKNELYVIQLRDKSGDVWEAGLRIGLGARGARIQFIGAGAGRRLQVSVA